MDNPLPSAFLVLGLIAAIYFIATVVLVHRYYKTKYTPNLPLAVTAFFFALAAILGILMAAAKSINLPLAKLFGRCCVMSGVLGFVFLNMFAVAMTRPGEKIRKMRGVWASFVLSLALMFVIWTCDVFVVGDVGGIPMFTATSMYKAPYGLPLIETTLALIAAMAVYPVYLFFRVAEDTKDRIIKIKSLLMGTGIIIATAGYAISITNAIPREYMSICRPMILVGTCIIFFSYMMPKQIELIFVGHAPASPEMVKSFVEKFFVYPVTPTVRIQPNAFSKTLGLDHQQMIGRKILFEFDPASNYETAIQDLATEALANAEPTVIFTRMSSAIHSSLREQKAMKFFCLTQQVSVPTEFSENEMLLPANDTSLMFDVFDKTLKAHPEANINVIFDSLSDLIIAIGFDKTYRFMRYTIEMLTSPKTTVMFLLNKTAHDPKVTYSFKSLFSNQISFEKKGIQPVKLSAHNYKISETKVPI